MTRFATTACSPLDHEQTAIAGAPAEGTEFFELEIESLLLRFRETHTVEHDAQEVLPIGTRTAVAAFLFFFICVPGCTAAAMFLVKSGTADFSFVQDQISTAKADRLTWPDVRAVDLVANRPVAALLMETLNEADLLEPISFRGSIEDMTFTRDFPNVSAPSKGKTRRVARRPAPPKLQPENTQAEVRSPSFLEKLFGVSFSINHNPPQT